jgi:hypothetical protein
VDHILSEWLTDIKRSQLPSILGGIGPMHSLVQLGKWRLRVCVRVLLFSKQRSVSTERSVSTARVCVCDVQRKVFVTSSGCPLSSTGEMDVSYADSNVAPTHS